MKVMQDTTVRIRVEFHLRDTGAMDDPSTVTFKYRQPGQAPTSLVYGVDSEVVREQMGVYHTLLTPDSGGEWPWRWEASGTLSVATQGTLEVEGSNV